MPVLPDVGGVLVVGRVDVGVGNSLEGDGPDRISAMNLLHELVGD